MVETVEFVVPATVSNLGPGFDCFGMSVDLGNRVRARVADRDQLRFSGAGAAGLVAGPTSLVWSTLRRCAGELGLKVPPLDIEIDVVVPPGRGLGSSATAVATGLALAVGFGEKRPADEELCALGTAIEGHPDNVVPALVGGLCFCLGEGGRHLRIEPPTALRLVASSPATEVSTAEARRALATSIERRDAVFNLCHASAMAAALATGSLGAIRELDLVQDRIHQHVRSRFIPGFQAAVDAGRAAGALGVCISGSGPTVLALCEGLDSQERVRDAIARALRSAGVEVEQRLLTPTSQGVLAQIA